jgi:hypothetical protein
MTNEEKFVSFRCMRQNKTFLIPASSIIHVEDFEDKNTGSICTDMAYVNFKNPNSNKKSPLYAVVDMSVGDFNNNVINGGNL